MNELQSIPKGEICLGCEHLYADCSDIDFDAGIPISNKKQAKREAEEGIRIVRCRFYRELDEDSKERADRVKRGLVREKKGKDDE